MASRPVALVTGAARRLGRMIALELGGHGWDVAVHYRGSASEAAQTAHDVATLGVRAHTFAADLADETACRALIPAVSAHFGGIHALINNASLFEYDSVDDFGFAAMERHMRANAGAPVLLAHALHAAGGGCVVNLLDQKLWNPNPDHLSYTLSKAALQEATTLLAQALAPRTRVCGVAPGVTLRSGPMDADAFDRAQRLTPLQRSSTPSDIAHAVRFLLESPAITGHTLLVDGGQHLQAQSRDVYFLAHED
jgi:NAD(P)-dependent dehydrogenase (short-subunit alcohol dehydrogenase family)